MGNAPQFRFEHWQMMWLLVVVAGVVAVVWLGLRLKAAALRAFAHVDSLRRIAASSSRPRCLTKAALLIAALVFVVLALMRPQGAPREVTVEKHGRDIVFLLDISRSMLAEDLKPNRLDRAKLAIEEMVDVMDGDRVGLIAFAGLPVLKCPLTNDYHFFKTVLNSTSPDDINRGGTNIGDAIRWAVKHVLKPPEPNGEQMSSDAWVARDIVLITDGEDLEESAPVTAAQVAARCGIRIHSVGIGNPDGARVPGPDGRALMYQNTEVRSHLDETTLREIAAATKGGRHVGVRTGIIDLRELYKRTLTTADKGKGTFRSLRYHELYQWPLFMAMVLLVIEALLSGRRPRGAGLGASTGLILAVALLPSLARADAPDAARLVREGNKAYGDGRYNEAADKYKDAERQLPQSPQAKFNLGAALYRQGDFSAAREQFLDVFDSTESNETLRRRAVYNLGATAVKEAEQKLNDGDLQGAVDAYRGSVALFRRAAGDDPAYDDDLADDARWNIEVARLRMKQILDEIKRQQEQAEQQRKEQEQKDQAFNQKLDKAIDEQKQIAEQAKQPPSSDEQRDALRQRQQENLDRTKELSDDLHERLQQDQDQQQDQASSRDQMQKAQENLDESQAHQAEASDHLSNQDDERTRQSAEQALAKLEQARDELSKQQEQQQAQAQQSQDEQNKNDQPSDERTENQQDEHPQKQQKQQQGEARRLSKEEAQRLLNDLKREQAKRLEEQKQTLEQQRGVRLIGDREQEQVQRDW
ncbi:MAG: VWA domain-containing protein [Verrucomicrobia bacterium]|nr:VWA domain-containing protein [Verrucomicrobiota bacterium]